MLIPSFFNTPICPNTSLSRRVNANSQLATPGEYTETKLIKKGEC